MEVKTIRPRLSRSVALDDEPPRSTPRVNFSAISHHLSAQTVENVVYIRGLHAAAGVFADYVSKNSYLFAQNGWYPVRKSVVESDEFQKSENDVVRLLKQTGNPENFYTLDGATNTWTVVKNFVYERNIVRAVNSETRLTEEDLAAMAEYLKKSIINAR